MSSSKQFFPDDAFASVRHVLPLSEGGKRGAGEAVFGSSPVVRMGPLAFAIVAGFLPPKNPTLLRILLQCKSVSRLFPWRGVVVPRFRILDDAGLKKLKELKRSSTDDIPVSSEKEWVYSESCVLKNSELLAGDSLFIEILLRIKVTIPLDPAAGFAHGWKIPSAILNAVPTTPTRKETAGTFLDPASGDLKIVSKEGDKVSAHRAILMSNSAVFNAMFSIEMSEKIDGTLKMELFGTKAVKILLKFLYTGSFKEEIEDLEGYDSEDFLEVVQAGDMYELPLLMKLAGVALLLRCNKEDVLEVFSRLKKQGKVMEETLTSLADFIQSNVHTMAVEF